MEWTDFCRVETTVLPTEAIPTVPELMSSKSEEVHHIKKRGIVFVTTTIQSTLTSFSFSVSTFTSTITLGNANNVLLCLPTGYSLCTWGSSKGASLVLKCLFTVQQVECSVPFRNLTWPMADGSIDIRKYTDRFHEYYHRRVSGRWPQYRQLLSLIFYSRSGINYFMSHFIIV